MVYRLAQQGNRDNVLLVNLKAEPIVEITEHGIRTTQKEYELDIIVFATGFDALTGPLLKLNLTGSQGYKLTQAWLDQGHRARAAQERTQSTQPGSA